MRFLIIDSVSEDQNGVSSWKETKMSLAQTLELVHQNDGYYETPDYSLEIIDFDFKVDNIHSFDSFLTMVKDCFISEAQQGVKDIFLIDDSE